MNDSPAVTPTIGVDKTADGGHVPGPICAGYQTHWHDTDGVVHWQPWRKGSGLAEETVTGRVAWIMPSADVEPPPPPPPPAVEARGPLSASERGAIGDYVRLVADRMGLRDWTFKVDWDEPQDAHGGLATIATVEKWYGRRTAQLAFRGRIAGEPAASVRHVIVHELCHLPFEPVGQLIDKSLLDALGSQAFNQFVEAYRLLHEEAVDHLAEALAPSMPEFSGWGPA